MFGADSAYRARRQDLEYPVLGHTLAYGALVLRTKLRTENEIPLLVMTNYYY